MNLFDRRLDTPERNLAADEALLDRRHDGRRSGALRFWEPTEPFVVLGYANRMSTEVRLEECARRGVSVYRRCTGGGTVVQAPGCLNYALILPIDGSDALRTVRATNETVMSANAATLRALIDAPVNVQGDTDLTIGGRKFSGNSSRRRRNAVLFHGTFLLNADMELIDALLRHPSREPGYRHGRSHSDFLTNLELPASAVKNALAERWGATDASDEWDEWPGRRIERLAREVYATREWTERR